MVGDQLREPIDLAVAHLQDAAGILEDRPGLKPPECDDLGNPVAAILALDVGDDLVAMGFAEVDVEIRHRHALRVEEAFEQQVQCQRVEIGNGQGPGDDRAGTGTTTRPHRNFVGLRPFDEVGDDQEVTGKSHAGDDIELIIKAFEIRLPLVLTAVLEPRGKSGMSIAPELLVLVAAKARQNWFSVRRGNSTALGNDRSIRQCFGQVGEQFRHRRRVLQPGVGR